MNARSAIFWSLLLGMLGDAVSAHAACTGTLTGRLLHAQRAGGWCDPASAGGQGCVGSKYLVDEVTPISTIGGIFGEPLKGLPEVPFIVRKTSNGMIVAQGVTDATGAFSTTFTDPCQSGFVCLPSTCNGSSFTATVEVPLHHQSGSFSVGTFVAPPLFPVPVEWTLTTNSFSFPRAPNVEFTARWGTAFNPSPLTNVYTSARKSWNRLKTADRLVSNLPTAFVAFPFDSTCSPATSCTACPEDGRATVKIGTNDALNIGRITHEMGHAAECAAHTLEFANGRDYSRDGPGHTLTSEEFKSATYAEGFADFVGESALYNGEADSPLFCREGTPVACSFLSNSLEVMESPTLGLPCSSFPGNHTRQQIFLSGFLWDLWDAHADVDRDGRSDTVNQSFNDVIHTLDKFPEGSDDHEENEHRCCAFWSCWACGSPENDSGHNLNDFLFHWDPLPVGQVREMNCSP